LRFEVSAAAVWFLIYTPFRRLPSVRSFRKCGAARAESVGAFGICRIVNLLKVFAEAFRPDWHFRSPTHGDRPDSLAVATARDSSQTNACRMSILKSTTIEESVRAVQSLDDAEDLVKDVHGHPEQLVNIGNHMRHLIDKPPPRPSVGSHAAH